MRAEKTKPLPVDTEAQAAEAGRREELAANAPYRRGVQQALANELQNVRGLFNQGLADLRRATLNRDVNVPGRDSYDRCYQRVSKVAARLKSIVGDNEKILMPAHLPPPGPKEQEMVEIGAPAFDVGMYRETRGLNADGTGLPLRGPGSNVDPNWLGK